MANKKSVAGKRPAKVAVKSKAKTISKKTNGKKPEAAAESAKSGRYKSFKLQKSIKNPTRVKMSNVWRLFVESLELLRANWKLFGGITFIYLLLSIVLTGVLSTSLSVNDLKMQMEITAQGSTSGVGGSLNVFSNMLGTVGGASSQTGAAYQSIILIVISLATIWALRHVLAGKPATVRDSFYKGMYPLIPFLLVLLVIGLQLLPLVIGGAIYSLVFSAGLAVGALEKTVAGIVLFLLALLSIYMICSSLFALYIVTLPDMRPMKALRSARELVRHRRWTILRKLIFLPFALVVVGAIIMVPLLMYAAVVGQVVFLVLSMLALVYAHTYIYTLYKELL